MKTNQIIAIAFVGIILFLGYMNFAGEDGLTVSVAGSVVKHSLIPPTAEVFGAIEEDYSNEEDAWVLLPKQNVAINIAAYHEDTHSTGMYYKAWVYDDWNLIWTSSELFLEPNEIKEWWFTYTTSPSEGQVTIYVESAVKDPSGSSGYVFDDMDEFKVITRTDAPPDPCEGVRCTVHCVGTTYYYSGYCVDGECEYSSDQIVGYCGYVIPSPTSTPTASPTASPTSAPTSFPTSTPIPDATDTPIPTATEAPVSDPCEGMSCPDVCVSPYTLKYDGICVDGTCEYTEIANSEECDYTEPAPLVIGETPTPVPTDFVPRYSNVSEEYTDIVGEIENIVEDVSGDLPINIYGASAIVLSILGAGAYLINVRKKE